MSFWNRKLADLKAARGLTSNTELAQFLGMSKGGLGNVLKCRKELSVPNKLRILSELGEEIDEFVFAELMPPKTRRDLGVEVRRLYDPEDGGELRGEDNFWVNRIDDLKFRFKVAFIVRMTSFFKNDFSFFSAFYPLIQFLKNR